MLTLLFRSILDYKKAWRKYMGFGLFFLLLTAYLFVPALAYLFHRVLLTYGTGVLLNREVFAILLNYRSALSLLLLAMLAVLVVLVELGVFLLIAQGTLKEKPVLVSEAFLTTLRALPKMLGFEMLYLVLLLFVVMPLVKLPVEPALTEGIQAPRFLMENIMASPWTRGLYGVALVGLTYLILRWIFTLHGVLLRRQRIRAAMKTSALLTHRIRVSLFLRLLALNLLLLGLGTGALSLLSMVPEWVGLPLTYPVRQFLVTFAGLMAFAYALMLMPLNMIFLTRLYEESGRRVGLPPTEAPLLVRFGWMVRLEERIHDLFLKRRVLLFGILGLNLILTLVAAYSVNDGLLYQGRDVAVVAHRGGYSEAPENSLSAIDHALSLGVDIIELDIQRTKDGVLVLHHDLSLLRMAGVPNPVSDFTLEELQALDIGSRVGGDHGVERIPSLAEALVRIGEEARVLLDVKDFGEGAAMAEDIVSLIEKLGLEDTVYVQAFDYGILQAVRQRNGRIRVGQIMYYALGNLTRLDVDFYTVQMGMLNRDLVASARRSQRELFVWTVRTEEDIKEVLQYDIDGIITNDVELALSILRPEPELFLEEEGDPGM